VNSRSLVVTASLVGIGLVAWFFFAWLVLDRNIFDAIGESVGSGLVLLLIVSLGGMLVRRN
jgi:hypothetical protein